jgi:hypothetical protein
MLNKSQHGAAVVNESQVVDDVKKIPPEPEGQQPVSPTQKIPEPQKESVTEKKPPSNSESPRPKQPAPAAPIKDDPTARSKVIKKARLLKEYMVVSLKSEDKLS